MEHNRTQQKYQYILHTYILVPSSLDDWDHVEQ